MYLTPESRALSILSLNGKKASEATATPSRFAIQRLLSSCKRFTRTRSVNMNKIIINRWSCRVAKRKRNQFWQNMSQRRRLWIQASWWWWWSAWVEGDHRKWLIDSKYILLSKLLFAKQEKTSIAISDYDEMSDDDAVIKDFLAAARPQQHMRNKWDTQKVSQRDQMDMQAKYSIQGHRLKDKDGIILFIIMRGIEATISTHLDTN